MKIFKFFLILLVFTFSLVMQSCNLDEELLDTPTPDLITTEADVTALINGAYARFNDAAAFKFQGMMPLMLMADDLYSDVGGEFGPYAQRTLSGVNTNAFWNQLYFSIGSANDLVSTLDKLELSPAFEKRAYGEAYFLRAFSYYYLVRMFGGVPLRLQQVNIDSDFYLPRSTTDEVYAQIFLDLKEASWRLPLYSQISVAELGRASKGAAQAILAQAYLTYGNQKSLKSQSTTTEYQNAIVYADSVIASGQYQLIDNYADIFDIAKESSAYNEVIFGIRFQTDQQARAQPAAGSEFALRFMAPATHFVTGRPVTGAGAGSIRPMPWVADYYRTGDYASGTGTTKVIDYRNQVAFYQRGFNGATNQFVVTYPNISTATEGRIATPLIGKYIDPNGKDDRNHGNDFFVIRFAEVYLIKAEAEYELNGPTAIALQAFNKVRERARTPNGTDRVVPADLTATTAGTKSTFRKKIFDERGLELIGEGQRWFDLVRMQHPADPTKTMYEYQFKQELVQTKYPKTLPVWRPANNTWSNANAVYAPALNVSVPKFLLFPVPTNEVLQNPSIGLQNQNPGW